MLRASQRTTTIFWPLSNCLATVLARRPSRCPLPSMTTYITNSKSVFQRREKGDDIKGRQRTTGSKVDILLCHRFTRLISSETKSSAPGYTCGFVYCRSWCRWESFNRNPRSLMVRRKWISEAKFVRQIVRCPSPNSTSLFWGGGVTCCLLMWSAKTLEKKVSISRFFIEVFLLPSGKTVLICLQRSHLCCKSTIIPMPKGTR